MASAIALICALPVALAQTASGVAKTEDVRIQELSWIDKNHIDQQIDTINQLALAKTGTPIRGDLRDLDTLQLLLEKNRVAQNDYKTQQAMGIVLGKVMQADFPTTLEWKIYQDNLGRSRALCVKGTSQCLFPITMLSRRIELGSQPDVKKIYNDSILLMEKYLPQLPYGGGIHYRLPRQ
ncbi:MAG TPA: DUF3806 domain-containing protein [Cellvibrio sp.]|nr:DUF3806 domain-containing protein [Cellvibrio sp.]